LAFSKPEIQRCLFVKTFPQFDWFYALRDINVTVKRKESINIFNVIGET